MDTEQSHSATSSVVINEGIKDGELAIRVICDGADACNSANRSWGGLFKTLLTELTKIVKRGTAYSSTALVTFEVIIVPFTSIDGSLIDCIQTSLGVPREEAVVLPPVREETSGFVLAGSCAGEPLPAVPVDAVEAREIRRACDPVLQPDEVAPGRARALFGLPANWDLERATRESIAFDAVDPDLVGAPCARILTEVLSARPTSCRSGELGLVEASFSRPAPEGQALPEGPLLIRTTLRIAQQGD